MARSEKNVQSPWQNGTIRYWLRTGGYRTVKYLRSVRP
jgi:hypothetical protein